MDELESRIADLEQLVLDLSQRLARLEALQGGPKAEDKPALRSRGMLDRPKPRS